MVGLVAQRLAGQTMQGACIKGSRNDQARDDVRYSQPGSKPLMSKVGQLEFGIPAAFPSNG